MTNSWFEKNKEKFDAEAAHAKEVAERLAKQGMEDDPHYYDFMPGYATEMDYLNSLEADDYLNEGGDEF